MKTGLTTPSTPDLPVLSTTRALTPSRFEEPPDKRRLLHSSSKKGVERSQTLSRIVSADNSDVQTTPPHFRHGNKMDTATPIPMEESSNSKTTSMSIPSLPESQQVFHTPIFLKSNFSTPLETDINSMSAADKENAPPTIVSASSPLPRGNRFRQKRNSDCATNAFKIELLQPSTPNEKTLTEQSSEGTRVSLVTHASSSSEVSEGSSTSVFSYAYSKDADSEGDSEGEYVPLFCPVREIEVHDMSESLAGLSCTSSIVSPCTKGTSSTNSVMRTPSTTPGTKPSQFQTTTEIRLKSELQIAEDKLKKVRAELELNKSKLVQMAKENELMSAPGVITNLKLNAKTSNRFKEKERGRAAVGPPVKSRQTILNESFVAAVKNSQTEIVGMILAKKSDDSQACRVDMEVIETALLHAVQNSDLDMLLLLVRNGASLRTEDALPIAFAASNPASCEMVVFLMSHTTASFDFDKIFPDGETLLLKAIKSQHESKVRLLLEVGARPDLLVPNSEPALVLASSLGCQDIVKLLL